MTTFLFTGGYTHDSPDGIHTFAADDPLRLDAPTSVIDDVEHPSFLCAHPTRPVLYAVSETGEFDGNPGGGIVAFAIDATDGSLTEIDRTSSRGDAPCHVAVDHRGEFLHVANYLSGSVATFALGPDGRFGRCVALHQHHGDGPTDRQEGPHAHCALPDRSGRRLYAVDLGTDEVIRYDATADSSTFTPAARLSVPAGTGPRHLALHPGQPLAALIGELDNTITLLDVGDDGGLEPFLTVSTRAADADAFAWAGAIRFSADGSRLYVTNRGDETLGVFAVGRRTLDLLGHVPTGGRTPRDLGLHPSGRALYIANQDSDTVATFAIESDTALPRLVDPPLEIPTPTCCLALEVAS